MEQIGLAEMLVELRRELLDAQRQAAEQKLQFKVEDIEVELKVGTTRKGTGKGSVKFWVAEVGGEASKEMQSLQTIRLKMKPLIDGEPLHVSSPEKK